MRSSQILYLCLVIVVSMLAVSTVTIAQGKGNSEVAQACKKGGWQELTNMSGKPFKNQGECVSYVVKGGGFPITGAPMTGLSVEFGAPTSQYGGPMTLRGSGLESGSAILADISYLPDSGLPDVLGELYGYADSDGNYLYSTGFECDLLASFKVYGTAANSAVVSDTAVPPC